MSLLDTPSADRTYDRWLVPPAALGVHLCIGQAYAFSVFNLPLSRVLGIGHSTPADWKLTQIGWTFTLAIVFLGIAAAFGGRWVERAGPRRSATISAVLWGGGFVVSALGVRLHTIALLYLGYGIIGGCGLGIGYITPVSTLIKWFPDRRGMATGMAIMGFGGGAMIASPLSEVLMRRLGSASSVGVAETFVALGAIYAVAMLTSALAFRLPPASSLGDGASRTAAGGSATVQAAVRTRAFYLLWAMLFVNVTAGIGVLGQASAMIQEVFRGRILAPAAAGFVGLLSLFNMGGRFIWSSISDAIGRKATYTAFFVLGPALYLSVPSAGRSGSMVAFVACFAIVMTLYGGGFATIPAYLSDLFGTQFVGAIHGRLLTAWSAAGIAGPALVNYIRQAQVDRGVPVSEAYTTTMYVMTALLAVGLVANFAVPRGVPGSTGTLTPDGLERPPVTTRWPARIAAWTLVVIPLAWGVLATATKAARLFAR